MSEIAKKELLQKEVDKDAQDNQIEERELEVTLENGDVKYKYKNISKLQFTGYLCQCIIHNLKEELTIEDIVDLTKKLLVALDNQKGEKN